MQEAPRITQTKILLSECFIAEAKLATFLFECMDEHGTDLAFEEMQTIRDLAHKVNELLSKIQIEQDKPPDKLPVYQIRSFRYGPVSSLENRDILMLAPSLAMVRM